MVEKQEIPLSIPINAQVPEVFVEEKLGYLKNNVKESIVRDLHGWMYSHDRDGRYKADILKITEELKELLPYPIPRRSKKLDFAVKKYVEITSSGLISIMGTKFKRDEFNNVFIEAYKNLGFRYGGMFINKFMSGYNLETIDGNFWNLVKEVREKTDESTTYLYAKWYYYMKSWELHRKKDNEINQEFIERAEISFKRNFLKVNKEVGYKKTHAFCRGVMGLISNTDINNFENYAYLSTIAGNEISNPDLAFWVIDTISLLEQEENFDYAPSQFLEDTKKTISEHGEKVAFSFVYGISGATKESRGHGHYLNEYLIRKRDFDQNPNWLEDGLERVEKSDKPEWKKEWERERLLDLKGYEKRLKKYYLPQKQAEIALYDPELFRKNFLKLLTEMGPREARLYAQMYNFGMTSCYNNGMESDIKFLAEKFPKFLSDFKKSVSKKVYNKAIRSNNTVFYGVNWLFRNFIDGVKKSYLRHGEKVTLERIEWTRKGSKTWGRINGLERPGRRAVHGAKGEKSKEAKRKKRRLEENLS